MQFFSKYSYIWRFPSLQEEDYNNFIRSSALTSLRVVSFITVFGMSLFLAIDYFRGVDFSIVLPVRIIVLLVAISIMVMSYRQWLNTTQIQGSVFGLAFAIFGSAMVTASYANMPSYYLTNLLFLIQILVVTASGLHLRNALLLNAACLFVFVIFSQYFKRDPFYFSQYPHLFSIFIYIHIIGVVLESRKRLNFLQFNELKEQKQLVEKLNQQKNKIISILSHDIASPVNSLLSLINLERRGQIKPEELKPFMEPIGDELSRVHTLILSLMRWSKSQMDGFSVVPRLFKFDELVRETISLFEIRLNVKRIKVQLNYDPQLWVNTDIEMMRLVLRNLISNSIKFSNVGEDILIKIRNENQEMIMLISNGGIKIDSKTQSMLFGFHMQSSEGTMNEKGSGLGLALAKHFTELNRGSLRLMPYTPENDLTTFALTLPLVSTPVESVPLPAEI